MSSKTGTLLVAAIFAVSAHAQYTPDHGLILLQQKAKLNTNQMALPKPWFSTSRMTDLRKGGDPALATFAPIPRSKRNKTGCASELNDPETFWRGVAGEYGDEDFAPHHKNLTNRKGHPLNDVFCASEHTPGQHRRNCTRYPTERERFDAIRRALKSTAKLFSDMGLTYYLDSGSLIGEWRCGDVLPWSEDADIHVPAADMAKAFIKIFGKSQKDIPESAMDSFMVTHEDNPLVPEDLVIWAWGWENSLRKAQPIGIADRATGFYVDVWIEEKGDVDKHGVEWLVRYWKNGPKQCRNRKGYTVTQCFKYPAQLVHPLHDCEVDGVVHKCPADRLNYLYIEYGEGVTHAPVQYRAALTQE